MGLLDRLFGQSGSPQPGSASNEPQQKEVTNEQAIQRYRYLLRTAPPEAIEQAHAEAFAQLTPEQRAQVLKELSQQVPPSERAAVPAQPDPQSLARLATRAELRQPGILERTLGAGGMGMGGAGFGSMLAGSLLGSIAGTVIGSAIAHQFLGGFSGGSEAFHHDMDTAQAQADTAGQGDSTDSDDSDNDSGTDDYGKDDYGSDDLGGGDFGGGDLGDA